MDELTRIKSLGGQRREWIRKQNGADPTILFSPFGKDYVLSYNL